MRQSVDYPVLRRARLSAGVGVKTALVNWMVWGFMASQSGLILGGVCLALGAISHLGLQWFFKIDHKIFEVYAYYATSPNSYRAGLPQMGESSSRKHGFGKGWKL